jgi:hypothetical protein
MMQIVGTDFFRHKLHKDFWICHFKRWYEDRRSPQNVVVTDLRFQNEVDIIKALGGVVWRVTRQDGQNGHGRHTMSDTHITESGVAELQGVDANIGNDGSLEQLYNKVSQVMERSLLR